MRPAFDTLSAIGGGTLMEQAAKAIAEATTAASSLNKAAQVTIVIDIKPTTKDKMIDAPLAFSGEVKVKKPQPERVATIFFVDEHGEPTQTAKPRQRDIAFSAVNLERHGK